MQGHNARHHEFHEQNRTNPEVAVQEAMQWWSELDRPPSHEDRMINEWAPFIAQNLTEQRLGNFTEELFVQVICKVYAFRMYADRAGYVTLGLSEKLPSMTSDARGEFLARRVFKQHSANGEDICSLLRFVLYGGPSEQVPDRIFEARYDPGRNIRHVGLSTLGEITGWAMPDKYPPRNGRTSKALYALGYDVVIHTE